MIETFRMLGREHEADLEREAGCRALARKAEDTRPKEGGSMTKRRIIGAVLAMLIGTATSFTFAATIGRADSDEADGRQLAGQYCTNPNAMPRPGACISLTFDGQTAEGYTASPNRVLTLMPGTYWLSVNDNSPFHNFSLENPDGVDQDITGIADTPGWMTVKVHLTHGTYTLFCDPHRVMGMYVVLEVGGAGQVG